MLLVKKSSEVRPSKTPSPPVRGIQWPLAAVWLDLKGNRDFGYVDTDWRNLQELSDSCRILLMCLLCLRDLLVSVAGLEPR